MGLDKTSVTSAPALEAAELDSILAALDTAATPARVLHQLLTAVAQIEPSHVAAGFLYNSSGAVDLVDEHQLPAQLRGHLEYPLPPATPDSPVRLPAGASAKLERPHTHAAWLQSDGHTYGGIIIWRAEPWPAASAGVPALISLLVRAAARALRQLELTRDLRITQAETLALQRITQAITRTLDFDKVVSTLLRHTRRLFNTDAVSLFLAHPETGEFTIHNAIGLSDRYVRDIRISLGSRNAQRIIKQHTPVQIYDATKGAVSGQVELIKSEGIQSILIAPIFSGSDSVGALCLYSKTSRHFQEAELRLSQNLAEQASIAFANANLHANMVRVSNEIEQTRNHMEDGLLVLDSTHSLRYFNAAAGKLLRLTSTSIGKPLTTALTVHGNTLSLGEANLAETLHRTEAGQVQRLSFHATGRDTRYFEAVCSPYRDAQGHSIGLLISIRDITQLYLEKEKLQTIQSSIQDGILMIDIHGRVTECNTEWRNLFALPQKPLGRHFFNDISANANVVFDQDITALVADVLRGKRLMCYARLVDRGRHLQLLLGPITSLGRVTGVVATAPA
ncbi:MAG TPA: PAS domain-containing protein, partial [Candidatus Saccharimonas sp.]|nr:PAS domain-containing protein [Candidatus Saccharimonas sp.]